MTLSHLLKACMHLAATCRKAHNREGEWSPTSEKRSGDGRYYAIRRDDDLARILNQFLGIAWAHRLARHLINRLEAKGGKKDEVLWTELIKWAELPHLIAMTAPADLKDEQPIIDWTEFESPSALEQNV